MDLVPYIDNAVRCLPGIIGTEGVNPTCRALGFPATGYIQQFLLWSPVTLAAGVVFGVPLIVFLLWRVFEILGIDF